MVVSRREYLEMKAQRDEWKALYHTLLDQSILLNEKIHNMVRDGYRQPDPGVAPDEFDELPMEIVAAISSRARTADMARDMETYARKQLHLEVEVGDVAREIWEGKG